MVDVPATRLKCNDFEAWITVDGEELKEYGVEDKEHDASCWIASETDKQFSVYYRKTTDTQYDYTTRLYLDGISVYYVLTWSKRGKETFCISCVPVSPTEGRNFIFGSLELTDDDRHLAKISSSKAIGEIKLEFTRVIPDSNPTDSSTAPITIPEAEKVHERSKKAFSHRIKFGGLKPLSESFGTKMYKLQNPEILATMVFRYRPLAMLQANGIAPHVPPPAEEIPRSLSPPGQPEKRKAADLKPENHEDSSDDEDSDGDIIAMTQTIRADLDRLEKKIAKKKQAKRSKKKVKLEASERTSRLFCGEVIDLTL